MVGFQRFYGYCAALACGGLNALGGFGMLAGIVAGRGLGLVVTAMLGLVVPVVLAAAVIAAHPHYLLRVFAVAVVHAHAHHTHCVGYHQKNG
jgi:hypothetical protein